jgi:uncharacterized glyoxalase superfamily protein PhnB
MTVRLNVVAPRLIANDVVRSANWYKENLGFKLISLYWEGNPEYAILERDGVEIHLTKAAVRPEENDNMLYIRVNGIEELYEHCSKRELVHPNGPLQTKPWKQREFSVIDPNGALLTFGERPPE